MRRAALLAVVIALGVVVRPTWSAFSASTVNEDNAFSAAGSFCTAPGTQTLVPNADAFVRQTSAGSNFGTASTVRVQSAVNLLLFPDNERTLVRFSLPAIPSWCTLTTATLRMNASSAAAGRTLQAIRAAAAWTETGVTWTNQPATAGAASTAGSGTGWREWDVRTQVEAMYAGTNAGFLVRDASEGAVLAQTQVFSSREGANPPQLVLTFA
ncbi:MAG: DNRLRE domain-containing protein [Actinomycetota bacterium]